MRNSWFLSGAILVFLFCCRASSNKHTINKINGVSFVAPRNEINKASTEKIDEINAGWVSLMLFAYCPDAVDTLIYNYNWQWWGEGRQGIIKCINLFKTQGKKVMIKPQIWVGHGEFTGDFDLDTDEAWVKWSSIYESYIMDYAEIAEKQQVEMFCIGTELKTFVLKRGGFWKNLISKVKGVYSGKLTYAANWDNYQNIPFWEELDYIGVDAYFPLNVEDKKGVDEVITAWEPHKAELLQFAAKHHKKLLFTEVGYRSIENSVRQPWRDDDSDRIDLNHQAIAYEALFQTFWHEPVFEGMFLWKWFDYHDQLQGQRYMSGFTPQNKPAQQIISSYYSKP